MQNESFLRSFKMCWAILLHALAVQARMNGRNWRNLSLGCQTAKTCAEFQDTKFESPRPSLDDAEQHVRP